MESMKKAIEVFEKDRTNKGYFPNDQFVPFLWGNVKYRLW